MRIGRAGEGVAIRIEPGMPDTMRSRPGDPRHGGMRDTGRRQVACFRSARPVEGEFNLARRLPALQGPSAGRV